MEPVDYEPWLYGTTTYDADDGPEILEFHDGKHAKPIPHDAF